MGFTFTEIMPAWPEIFLACAAMGLLVLGVFMKTGAARSISWLSVLALVATGILEIVVVPDGGRVHIFNQLFVADVFTTFVKCLILGASAVGIIMSLGYNDREDIARFEFPILILLATLGMMMMVSAADLISLYVGLELQSLSLYVIAAFRRDSVKSSEAGLKYFVLGALASGMLLYGSSMIYGFSGSTNFLQLAKVLDADASAGIIVGLVFVMVGLAFKISAFPFHMWTPDVYEGAPTPVTAFFAAAPKMAAMALFISVLVGPFGNLVAQWQQVLVLIAIGSMLLGGFAAITQSNIKRLLAYSSIGNMGYALIGLSAGTKDGYSAVLIYMSIYLVMTVGAFAVVLCMRREGRMVEEVKDLAGLSKTQPAMAALMALFMFSMAGIPPLAGFFGKFYVFLAAIEAKLYILAIIGVLASVVAAYYYLRIVMTMYFTEPVEDLDRNVGPELSTIQAIAGAFVLFFILFAEPVVQMTNQAIASLTSG